MENLKNFDPCLSRKVGLVQFRTKMSFSLPIKIIKKTLNKNNHNFVDIDCYDCLQLKDIFISIY